MKNKYIGLWGMAAAGSALLIVLGELLWISCRPFRPDFAESAFDAYASERILIDDEAVGRMDLVEPTLPKLVRPEVDVVEAVVGKASGVDYSMFGDRPPKPVAAPVVATSRPRSSKPYPHRVAMTYLSGEHRYAVINKKLYKERSRLPTGENLAEITDGAVRLESAAGPRWISVEGAGER